MSRLARKLLAKVGSRLNVVETFRSLVEVGRKHGLILLLLFILTEATESIVLPALLWRWGYPHLIPVALAVHTEPLVAAVYFAARRYRDRPTTGQ